MKKFLLIAITILASSCAPTYIPNIRNSPMFTDKGEVQLNFQVGNGLNGQGAWALSEHFGVMANYSYLKRSGDEEDNIDYRKHTFGEGGVGYFKNTEDMFFEFFAGYGEGMGASDDALSFLGSSGTATAAGNYKRYFFQPAFGMNKKTVFVSFVPRFSLVEFTEFSSGGVRYVVNEDPTLFFEPAVIGRVNFHDNFYFIFQGGFSVPVTDDPFFEYRTFQTSTGIGVRFGGKKALKERE
ncbi:MAG TPA: hypothetical protein VGD40_15170 [Chryseosolibacter sp.]